MTSAKVKEPLEKIVSFIKKYIDERKLVIAEETDSSIAGVYALGELKLFFRWFIRWDNSINGYILSLKIESSKALGTGLSLLSVLIVLTPLLSLIKGSISILIYFFALLFGKAFLDDAEYKFFRSLEKEFVCSVEKDPDINLLSKKVSWVPEAVIIVYGLCLLLRFRVYYVFLFILITFVMNLIPKILNAVSKTGFLNWKNNLVILSGHWTGVLSSIIIYYLILYYFFAWVENTIGIDSFAQMVTPMRNFVFMGLNFIVGMIIIYLFFAGISSSKASWEEAILKNNPSARITSYSKADKRELLFNKIGIIVMFLLAAALNWVAFILIIDTFSFLIIKKVIILKGLNSIYARLFEFRGYRIILPFMLIISLPFLFSIFLSIARLFQNIFRSSFLKVDHLNDEMKSKWSELYQELNQASEHINIRAPKIINEKGNYALCYSAQSIIFRKTRIVISTKALEILEPKELKGIAYHELYHITKGMGRIEIAKLISRLGMFPNYFLPLLFDLNAEEHEADSFVVKELGEEYACVMTEALYKIDINNKVALSMSRKKKRKPNKTEIVVFAGIGKELKNLGKFLYGQKLLGYSHPSIVQRTEKLK